MKIASRATPEGLSTTALRSCTKRFGDLPVTTLPGASRSFNPALGPPTSAAKPGPTIHNKARVAFLPAFLSRVFQLADEVSYLRLK